MTVLFLEPLGRIGLPLLLLAGAGLLVCVFVLLAALRRRAALVRWGLTGLRVLIILLLFGALLRPSLRLSEEHTLRPRLVVLADGSGSMAAPLTPGGEPRWEAVRRFLTENTTLLAGLGAELSLALATTELQRLPSATVDSLPAQPPGGLTALQESLDQLFGPHSSPAAEAVLLLSDGRETQRGNRPAPPADQPRWPGPVYPLLLDHGGSYPDAALAEVDLPATISRGKTSTAHALLRVPTGQPLTGNILVERYSDTEPHWERLASVKLDLTQPAPTTVVNLPFREEQLGYQLYRVRLTDLPQDAFPGNNELLVSTQVVEEAKKVVLLGRPSWDYRFLHRAISGDPSLAVQSVPLVDVTLEDSARRQGLTQQALSEADLIVLLGLDPLDLPESWRPAMLRKIEEGGASLLWFLGGAFPVRPQSAQLLQEMLPVFVETSNTNRQPTTRPAPVLDAADAPYLALHGDPVRSEALWERIPPVGPLLLGIEPAASATVALQDPASEAPVVFAGPLGSGRYLLVLTEELWRWSLQPTSAGEVPFGQVFFSRLVQSLVKPTGSQPIQRLDPQHTFPPGQPLDVEYTLQLPDLDPTTELELRITALPEQSETGPVENSVGEVSLGGPWLARADSNARIWRARLPALPVGAYRLKASLPARPEAPAETSWLLVQTPRAELVDVRPAPEFLAELAERSGGTVLSPEALSANGGQAIREALHERTVRIERLRELWDTWPYFLLLVALLGSEWYLRKRLGLR